MEKQTCERLKVTNLNSNTISKKKFTFRILEYQLFLHIFFIYVIIYTYILTAK